MAIELVDAGAAAHLPVHLVGKGGLDTSGLDPNALIWAKANGFDGEAGKVLVLPGEAGGIGGALFGTGNGEGAFAPLATGALARALPSGDWRFANPASAADLAVLGLVHGGDVFYP